MLSVLRLLTALYIVLGSVEVYARDLYLGVHENYSNDQLKIAVNQQGYADVLWVKDCPELLAPEMKDVQRLTMDLLIICQAVKTADIADRLVLRAYPNVARGMDEIVAKRLDMVAQSLFLDTPEIEALVLVTAPLIRSGEFEVGVFTTRNRPEIMQLQTLSEFQQHIAVTVQSWVTDRGALERLGIQQIQLVSRRDLISRFIENKRADFFLSYLKEPVLTRIGGELIRIPNVKVSFPQERSFFVSKDKPELYQALQRYIQQERAKSPDAIHAAYVHAGFIAPEYAHWTDLSKLR